MLDVLAGLLIVAGGFGAYWAYKRSLSSLETLGDAAVELPPKLDAPARAEVQKEARPEVAELNTLAQRLEAGEKLSPAEHAHVATLVQELAQAEQRPADA